MARVTAALAVSLLLAGAARAQQDDLGQDVYNGRCAACHGRDAKGKTPIGVKLKAKDLTDAVTWKGLTDAAIEKLIDEGTPDKAMPAYQGKLSADERAAVVKYLRVFQPK